MSRKIVSTDWEAREEEYFATESMVALLRYELRLNQLEYRVLHRYLSMKRGKSLRQIEKLTHRGMMSGHLYYGMIVKKASKNIFGVDYAEIIKRKE
jgi:hypothetical protein